MICAPYGHASTARRRLRARQVWLTAILVSVALSKLTADALDRRRLARLDGLRHAIPEEHDRRRGQSE